jgi:hypothetical protein
MSFRKSAPKPSGSSPAAPLGKDPNVAIVATEDIAAWLPRDAGNVRLLGSYPLKPGAKVHTFYCPSSKINATSASEGDEDAIGILQKFEAMAPGNQLELREFVAHWNGRPCLIFLNFCKPDIPADVYGTKCSPMQLKAGFEMNNDSTGFSMAFEQFARTEFLPGIYEGTLAYNQANDASDFDLDLLQINPSQQYNLPASAVAATTIDIASTTVDNDTIVSLVGDGGSEPAVLENGAATAATVVLKSGTSWIALKEAVIHLKAVNDGTTTYFIEVFRQ